MVLAGRIRFLLLLTALAVAGAWVAVGPVQAQDVRFIRIGTGPIGGTYFPVGGLIANIVSGPPGTMACDQGGSCGVPGLIAAAVSTQGSPDNVQQMATGAIELALCQADVAHDAATGSGPFAGRPVASLRTIANLFPEAVHVVVRRDSDLGSVRDLKGRRVAVGESNSGTLASARIVLRGFGLGLNDLKPVYERLARSADLLTAGEIDAFFMVGGLPVAAITLAAERTPLALLPIAGREAQRILEAQPFFTATTIPADTYLGVAQTPSIGVGAQLLVAATVDADLVYAITQAIWDPRNRRVLDSGNPIARRTQRQSALDGLAVPLHPGARRYYQEKGMQPAAERKE